MMVVEPAQPRIDDDNIEDIGDMVTAYCCEIAVDVMLQEVTVDNAQVTEEGSMEEEDSKEDEVPVDSEQVS